MSDFFNHSWSLWIAITTILGLIACLVLLLIASRRKVMSQDNTIGHVWDEDLKELNNPLPRWWMLLFVITIVFALAYLALYPGLGSHQGILNWSSQSQYETEKAQARTAMAPIYNKYLQQSAQTIAADPQAMAIGQRLFINQCSTCHGSDGRGSKGFPNLTDADWLYGGDHETIKLTITKGRQGMMPPMAAAIGNTDDERHLAHYVMSLSGSPHNSLYAQMGKSKFRACAGCHGANGRGNQTLGAPNFTDKIWLHGWGEQAIMRMIQNGKHNVMPAQEKWLTPEQIHVLAAYVWGLSRSTTAKPQ